MYGWGGVPLLRGHRLHTSTDSTRERQRRAGSALGALRARFARTRVSSETKEKHVDICVKPKTKT